MGSPRGGRRQARPLGRAVRPAAVSLVALAVVGAAATPAASTPPETVRSAAGQVPAAGTDLPIPVDQMFDTVPFRPQDERLRVGELESGAIRRHRVTVVPYHSGRTGDDDRLEEIVSATKRFWTERVPGMKVSMRILDWRKVSASRVCSAQLMADAASVAGTSSSHLRPGDHVAALSPQCPGVGQGELRDGRGLLWAGGGNGHAFAHEFGHNLGLMHGNRLVCSADGTTVPLSSQCKEYEYADVTDVMGSAFNATPLLPDITVSGVPAALLGLRTARVDPEEVTTVTLAVSGRRTRSALVDSRFGTIALAGAATDTETEDPAGLKSALWTAGGFGVLAVPDPGTGMAEADSRLERGDAWNIEGTGLRVVVLRVTERATRVRILPRSQAGPPPAPPGDPQPPGEANGWLLTWASSAGPHVIAYQVEADGRVVTRVGPGTTTAALTSLVEPAQVRVVAVGRDGGRAASATVAVEPIDYSLRVSTSAVIDPVTGRATVAGPFEVSWTLTPTSAPVPVSGWTIDADGPTAVTVGAEQRSVTLDPSALGWSPGVHGIAVSGIDDRAGLGYAGTMVTYRP